MRPYFIQSTDHQVDFYSTFHLPYEPDGIHRRARSELREALGGLRCGPSLSATLATSAAGRYDVENLLLYNVGGKELKRLSTQGLDFCRQSGQDSLHSHFTHHHCYRTGEMNDEPMSQSLVSFDLSSLNTQLKPHQVWWEMVRRMPASFAQVGGNFRLHIRLISCRRSPGLAQIVKPLLDGIVSALHFTTADVPPVVVSRLAAALHSSPAEVFERLTCREGRPLGCRQTLLRPTASFVAWNPKDENCVAASLRWLSPSQAPDAPRIEVGLGQVCA